MDFEYYLENVKFKKNISLLSESVFSFPTKEIFQTFNSLSREERKKIINILNNKINKALSSDEKKNLLNDVKNILLKKNPNLVSKFI